MLTVVHIIIAISMERDTQTPKDKSFVNFHSREVCKNLVTKFTVIMHIAIFTLHSLCKTLS